MLDKNSERICGQKAIRVRKNENLVLRMFDQLVLNGAFANGAFGIYELHAWEVHACDDLGRRVTRTVIAHKDF
jgi:hypothetical protein